MAHARTLIREAAVAALASVPSVNGRVLDSPVFPHVKATLPDISVFTRNEGAESGDFQLTDKQIRSLALTLEIRVKQVNGYAALADQIETEASQALYGDSVLDALVISLDWQAADIDTEGDQEQPIVVSVLQFMIMYQVDATDPSTPL